MADENNGETGAAGSSSSASLPWPVPFLLSAETPRELLLQLDDLERIPEAGLARFSSRLAQRPPGGHRLGLVAGGKAELLAHLEFAREHLRQPQPPVLKTRSGVYYGFGAAIGKVALLFPGQGSQYPGMLREFCDHIPEIQTWFDELDGAFLNAGAGRPSQLLSPDASPSEARGKHLFGLDAGAQLGLAASLALYSVLARMRLPVDFVLGHSNGEHAALMAAGVIEHSSIREGCEFMCRVAMESKRLPQPRVPEGMLAIGGPRRPTIDRLLSRSGEGLFVAVDNCPTQVVLAGYREALAQAESGMRGARAICSWLPFARAHHTPLFADWSRLLEKHYESLPGGPSRLKVYSCSTARPYPAERKLVLKLLAEHWSGPVRFRESVEALYAAGARIFIEAGPDSRLTPFVDDTLRGKPHRSLNASTSFRSDFAQLAHLAAELHSIGIPLDLGLFHESLARLSGARPAAMDRGSPEKRRPGSIRDELLREHEITARLAAASASRIAVRMGRTSAQIPADEQFPLLGKVYYRDSRRLRTRQVLTVERYPFLLDHCLGRAGRGEAGAPLPVLAFTVSAEIAAEAAACLSAAPLATLTGIRAHNWLAVEQDGLTIEVEAAVESAGIRIQIFAVSAAERTLSFEAIAVRGERAPARGSPDKSLPATPPSKWDRERFYRDYAFHGPSFQGIERVDGLTAGGVEARIAVTRLRGIPQDRLQLDPAVLDCAGQLAALWALENGGPKVGAFPFALRQLTLHANVKPPGEILRCHASVRRSNFGTLLSSFEFSGSGGSLLARLEDFEQRLVPLPDPLWETLFGRGSTAAAAAALVRDGAMDWTFLTRQGGIWSRALAHLLLTPAELREWRQQPAGDLAARLRHRHAAQASAAVSPARAVSMPMLKL